MRVLTAKALLLIGLSDPAFAGPDTTPPVNCPDVIAVVAAIGEKAATKLAHDAGASKRKMTEAKRCLVQRSKSNGR